jgi:hypothetical protein
LTAVFSTLIRGSQLFVTTHIPNLGSVGACVLFSAPAVIIIIIKVPPLARYLPEFEIASENTASLWPSSAAARRYLLHHDGRRSYNIELWKERAVTFAQSRLGELF